MAIVICIFYRDIQWPTESFQTPLFFYIFCFIINPLLFQTNIRSCNAYLVYSIHILPKYLSEVIKFVNSNECKSCDSINRWKRMARAREFESKYVKTHNSLRCSSDQSNFCQYSISRQVYYKEHILNTSVTANEQRSSE